MKRRSFVQNTILSGGLLNLKSIDSKVKTSLKPIGLATNWGWTGTIDAFAEKAKSLGFDGFEMWFPMDLKAQDEVKKALEKHQLQIGFLIGSGNTDVKMHTADFKKALDLASNFSQKPLFLNCHSGKDYFSFEDNCKIIELTLEKATQTGLKIGHETHRGRMCFAAHITRNFLEKYKDMKLTLDISHWTNVHESLLADQKESVDLALKRVIHIHTRVGHQEGPQVNDPRAPEWSETLNKHLSWWDTAVENIEKSGEKQFTFLTEFGPPSYLPTLPYTNVPVADQWDINVHMLKTIRNRYS